MKICVIRDEYRDLEIGYLYYYEKSDIYIIELSPHLSRKDAPVFFDEFVEKKILTIDPLWSRRYVETRVVPRDRQNLRSILKEAGLREYDPFRLLMLSLGECSQDDCKILPTSEVAEWIAERKKTWIISAAPLEDFRMYLSFRDGTNRIVEMKEMLSEDRSLRILLSRKEDFENVQVLGGGRILDWGANRFCMSNDVYQMGDKMVETGDDLVKILRSQLIDVRDLCKMHQVSRQYVNSVLQRYGIREFRKCGSGNLYLRSQVEELFE